MYDNIADALNDLPDEMIEQAEQAYMGKRKRGSILWRVAALAATVAIVLTATLWPGNTEDGFVTAPGVMKVYAYDLMDGVEVKTSVGNKLEDVEYLPGVWSPYMSAYGPGLAIAFEIPEDYFGEAEITYDISVNYGECFKYHYETGVQEVLDDQCAVKNGEKFYWRCDNLSEAEAVISKEGGIYVNAVVKADGKIAGYAILEIGYAAEPVSMCFPVRCETVCYPMVETILQDVSAEYVQEQMSVSKTGESASSGEEKLAEYLDYVRAYFAEKE